MQASEWLRGMELVWLVWLVGLAGLLTGLARAFRRPRWPSLSTLHGEESGASYTISYVMIVPVYLVFLCAVAECSLLMIAKAGTMYAAHAGARSAIVWESAQPAGRRQARNDQAVYTAMAPFTGSSPRHMNGSSWQHQFQADEFSRLYRMYAKAGESAAAPPRPYARLNPSDDKLRRRYLVAASRTRYTLSVDRSKADGAVTCTVTFDAPLYIPGAARFLGVGGGRNAHFPIRSTATLPREAPASANGRLGIDYESR